MVQSAFIASCAWWHRPADKVKGFFSVEATCGLPHEQAG